MLGDDRGRWVSAGRAKKIVREELEKLLTPEQGEFERYKAFVRGVEDAMVLEIRSGRENVSNNCLHYLLAKNGLLDTQEGEG